MKWARPTDMITWSQDIGIWQLPKEKQMSLKKVVGFHWHVWLALCYSCRESGVQMARRNDKSASKWFPWPWCSSELQMTAYIHLFEFQMKISEIRRKLQNNILIWSRSLTFFKCKSKVMVSLNLEKYCKTFIEMANPER